MKKIPAIFIGIIVAILLLPCTQALAAPLTPEEIAAKGDNITERERIDTMNYFFKKANPNKDIPTVLHLEKDVAVKDGKLFLSWWRFNVNNPDVLVSI